jgi:DNA-binding NarL/FixJ family response regulator
LKRKIKILIADDHELLRKGCASLLRKDSGISVVGEAENGKEVLEILKQTPVDVILMDLEMPIMDGNEAMTKIKILYPQIKIIMISAHYNDTLVTDYISRGASAYLYKNINTEKLLDAVYSVFEKGQYFDYFTANAMLTGLKNSKSGSLPGNQLSEREKEVLSLVCKDYTNSEIGERLHLSARTIAFHRKNITRKTSCKRTAQLVLYAIKIGLLNIENKSLCYNEPLPNF